jgi:methylated-DNA-[protein]-cysteine S-methyltransferase
VAKCVTIYYESPIGLIEIAGSERGVEVVRFVEKRGPVAAGFPPRPLLECLGQIDEYFQGKRREFSLTLSLKGTPFQLKVWRRLQRIPFGSSLSYGEVAADLKRPGAARAVGGANHKNPVSIIVPCHRVVGSGGVLVGYGGGLWRKKWLLNHERTVLSQRTK